MSAELAKQVDNDLFAQKQAQLNRTSEAIEIDRLAHSQLLRAVAFYSAILVDIANAPIGRSETEVKFCGIRLSPSAANVVASKLMVAASEITARNNDNAVSKMLKPAFEAAHDPH
jgi:hypothetical protein